MERHAEMKYVIYYDGFYHRYYANDLGAGAEFWNAHRYANYAEARAKAEAMTGNVAGRYMRWHIEAVEA